MRLIDADKLLDDGIKDRDGINAEGLIYIPMADVRNSIRNAPTVDAVPVVRCGECVHQYRQDYGPLAGARFCNVWCMINGMGDDGFCNYVEPKEGDDNES